MDKQGPILYLLDHEMRNMNVSSHAPHEQTDNAIRIIGLWLIMICIMVFAMVVLGGFTRLTESGLSMTDWRPVTGWLPPMSEAAWQAQFDGYRASPEYL